MDLTPPVHPAPLDDPIRAAVVRLCRTYGVSRVATAIGVSRGALQQAAAGLDVWPRTARRSAAGLDRLREAGEVVP